MMLTFIFVLQVDFSKQPLCEKPGMSKCNGNELSRSSFDCKIDSNDIIFGTSEKKKTEPNNT